VGVLVTYFETREIAGITIFAALWGILNVTLSPIFFQMFHLPFLCDVIGFSAITLAVWWVRKMGTATLVGFIATVINFMLRPDALHFLGFTAASMSFDVLSPVIGYKRLFEERTFASAWLFVTSVISAAVAGLIIGSFFMAPTALQQVGGILGWAALHAAGGVIGGAIGVILMNALIARGFTAKKVVQRQK
jgi:hypothetical protein